MENNNSQYWKGLDELHREPEFEKQRHNEFIEKLPLAEVMNENEMGLTANRRDFLKFMGFSISAATLAACQHTPVKKVIPYVIKPQDVDPGVANYYATTCSGCQSRCSLLVKTREGRPIKIEGNANSPFSRGGVCAVGQATVLSLYDSGRLSKPRDIKNNKKKVDWSEVDAQVKASLSGGGAIRILTGSVLSPSTKDMIAQFTAKYPGTQHIQYDAVSSYALLAAHQQAFGKPVVPNYKIEDADMLVSFGADFLGSWISPVEYTKQYAAARKVDDKKSMLYHVQFETTLSLSGSNADLRVPIAPSQYGVALSKLHNLIAGQPAGGGELAGNSLQAVANQLMKNKGKSIVICGSNDINHQLLVASINNMLGNYGSTIDMGNYSLQRQGDDKAMINLVREMNAGTVGTLIIADCNPSYTYPQAAIFNDGLKKVKLSVYITDRLNETAENVSLAVPETHFLESWSDAQPKAEYYSLYQPTISPIFDSRTVQECFAAWIDKPQAAYDIVRAYWQKNMGSMGASGGFEDFWARSLQDGYFVSATSIKSASNYALSATAVSSAMTQTAAVNNNTLELVLYEKVAIRDGKEANNPWLQELPDPVSKVTWDNYAVVSPKWAHEKGLTDEDVIEIRSGNTKVSLPILRQPGQRDKTIAIAFGYGRKIDEKAGKVMNEVGGANAFPFAAIVGDTFSYQGQQVEVSGKTGTYPLALTQTHHHLEGRDHVRETTVAELSKYNAKSTENGEPSKGPVHISLWKDYRFPGHHWGMAIDLSACTGCNACVVSCTAENNVPVVGKDEVRRRREMHWLRLDRYYAVADTKGEYHEKNAAGEMDKLGASGDVNYENVKVVFQPMLCQHCENAPCETVCPVNAISHSSEGINQQVYNRCVGTRYCANNCPYKVRRFNWFNYAQNERFQDYNTQDALGRMVLNPDVVVRARGVMEKCTFCIQRIQAGKLEAKKEGRPLRDGEVKTACQQTCPANAIVFGDMNDPNSQISKLMEHNRSYGVLTVLNTRPSLTYMAKVRNNPENLV